MTAPSNAPTVAGRLGEATVSVRRAMSGTPGRLRVLALSTVAVSLIFALSAFSTFFTTPTNSNLCCSTTSKSSKGTHWNDSIDSVTIQKKSLWKSNGTQTYGIHFIHSFSVRSGTTHETWSLFQFVQI